MTSDSQFPPLSFRKLKNLEKRFADYSRSDNSRFRRQTERLLDLYEYEVLKRMRLNFDVDIKPYAEALTLCEVGYGYPLGVTRGNADFFKGLAALHIEELVYGANGKSRWPFEDVVVAENASKLTEYYARRYQGIVDEKDQAEDWKYGFSGWYGLNDGEHGDQCKRCAHHGEPRYCCKYCNICHHCFPFCADLDSRYIEEYEAHLAFLERSKSFAYEVIHEGIWHFVAKVEARNDQREITAYRRVSANYRTYEIGSAYKLRDEMNGNANGIEGGACEGKIIENSTNDWLRLPR